MKIKAGQYVRTSYNLFLQTYEEDEVLCVDINNEQFYIRNGKIFRSKDEGGVFDNLVYTGIIKVKDTPRELIQVGDLIINETYWNEPLLVTHFDNQGNLRTTVRTSSGGETISINKLNITKILTPNSNGGYDLQWEAQDE